MPHPAQGAVVKVEVYSDGALIYEETLVTDYTGAAETTEPIDVERGEIVVRVDWWRGVPLGYAKSIKVAAESTTIQLVLEVPTCVYVVQAFSLDGTYLEDATIAMSRSYDGRPVFEESSHGTLKAIIPIPKVGSVDCTIRGYGRGVMGIPTKVSVPAGMVPTLTEVKYTIPISVAVPIFGTYSNLIIFVIALLIISIVITIALIEYAKWRRANRAARR